MQLADLENCPLSKDKPIIHQAVLVHIIGWKFIRLGILTLSNLVGLGFDVTALDKNGQHALEPLFLGESLREQSGNAM